MTTINPSATNPEKAKFISSLASNQPVNYNMGSFNVGNGTLNPGTNPTPTTGPTPTDTTGNPTPTDPNATPVVQSPTDIAFENYLKALTPSTEETQAKQYVDRLVADSKLANERALNSGETMGFASGEAQRVNRNNNLTIDAAKSAYDTTKSFRESRANVEKLRYEYNNSKATKAEKDNAPFNLSEGQSRYTYDPETKQYKIVAAKAKTYAPKSVSQPKAVTAAQKLKDDINSAVEEQKQIVATGYGKGPRAGVDPAQYKILLEDFQREHGSKGVAEFIKALSNSGLKVDVVGDSVGYN